MANPNFLKNLAMVTNKVIRRDFVQQIYNDVPLLRFASGYQQSVEKTGTQAHVPILYTGPQNLTINNIGVDDADEIPTSWPTFPRTQGVTRAVYEYTHFRVSMTMTDSEKVLLSGSALQTSSLLQWKLAQLRMETTALFEAMLGGSQPDSRKMFMGIPFFVSNVNTVGGISQASNPYWRAHVQTMATVSLSTIQQVQDLLGTRTMNNVMRGSDKPAGATTLLCAAPEGGFNTFNALRQLIQPNQRIVSTDTTKQFGAQAFEFSGLTCTLAATLPASTMYLMTPGSFAFDLENWRGTEWDRIQGSDAYEQVFTS